MSGVVGRGCRGTSCPAMQQTWQSLSGAEPSAEHLFRTVRWGPGEQEQAISPAAYPISCLASASGSG
jgi:hypothetical protein